MDIGLQIGRTKRSKVSSGNFQPAEVRAIPDSPNLQVLWFLSHTPSHMHCSSLRCIRRCFVNIFYVKKIAGHLIFLYLRLDYLYCIFFLSCQYCPPYLLLLFQRKQFRGWVRRKAGEFGQKAGKLDDKLTCSKPIRKPFLTQLIWDK